MPRPFELFSGYDFFSVLLPGLASATLAFLFLPAQVAGQIGPLTALIPVLVLAFSLGQGLHSVAQLLEKLAGKSRIVTPHRDLFAAQIENPDWVSAHVVDSFLLKVADSLLVPVNDPYLSGESMRETNWRQVYTFVQSYIYTYEIGRSRKFQSIYSFCRSMFVLSIAFPVITFAHDIFRNFGFIFDRPPQYTLYFTDFGDFFEATVFVGTVGAGIFWYGAYSYKRNFIRYLISDFIAYSEPEAEQPTQ